MASAPEKSAAFKKFKEEQLPVFGQSDFDNLTQASAMVIKIMRMCD